MKKTVVEQGICKILKVGDYIFHTELYGKSKHVITRFVREDKEIFLEIHPPIFRTNHQIPVYHMYNENGIINWTFDIITRISINQLKNDNRITILTKEDIHNKVEEICNESFVYTKLEPLDYSNLRYDLLNTYGHSLIYRETIKREPIYKIMSPESKMKLEQVMNSKQIKNSNDKNWKNKRRIK